MVKTATNLLKKRKYNEKTKMKSQKKTVEKVVEVVAPVEDVSDEESDIDSSDAACDVAFRLQFDDVNTCEIGRKSLLLDQGTSWRHSAIKQDEKKIMLSDLEEEVPVSAESIDGDSSFSQLQIKPKLTEGWKLLNGKLNKKTGSTTFTPMQASLYGHLKNYKDLSFSNETQALEGDIRHLLALHSLDHIYKARDSVIQNTMIIKKQIILKEELRDQGFTKPKVLVLLPFKNDAYQFINDLISLSGCTQLDNKKRFEEEFAGDTRPDPRKKDDFNHTFSGDIDDCFKIGLKFSKKQLKLYSSFYSSDIIIASPLGLEMIIGKPGDEKRDFDYLSSIEVIILDKADYFLMQNWDHVKHILDHLNLIPTTAHGCDFSRTRNYMLDSKTKYVRQTILISHLSAPELNSLATIYGKNVAGKVKITKDYEGSITDVIVQAPQVFHRVPVSSLMNSADVRFNFFIAKILPTLRMAGMEQGHTMIVIPSYFDFVRVRNYLVDHNYSLAPISEYTSRSKVDRYRNEFKSGEVKFMLYSERYHFFRRTKMKGYKHIVFYALPVFPSFYSDLVNGMKGDENTDCTCTSLFSAFDRLSLERIVGSARMSKMVKSDKDAFMFATN